MLRKLQQLAFGGELELRERMFRIIILIGGLAAVLGMLEYMTLTDVYALVVPLFAMTIVIGIAIVATFKYRKIEISAVLVGIAITVIVFPAMFFLSGGVNGGAAIWFVQGMFYIFIMFSGRRLAFFLSLSIVVDMITYWLAYHHPEMVIPMESPLAAYLDSFFGVVAVGITVGAILKFQMKIFQNERATTLSQKEELEKISNSKNEFFANMSHEIRTPINTIIGLNEMILRETNEAGTREYAGNIQIASKMLLNLVNDIMDLSQMEIRKMEIVPVKYKTKGLFEELIDMVRTGIKEKQLEFMVDIDGNLPCVLFGDEKRIKQILLNILANAVKYTETGSVMLSAHAESLEEGEIRLKVSVADTGIGIRKEDLEHLYDPFKRVDEKSHLRVEGSGLGLSICKQLIDLMGGEITVDSIYTKGSVFTVILRQRVIDSAPIGNVQFLKKGSEGEQVYYKQSFEAPEARILIVDDNKMNSMVVSRLLRSTKVQTDIAGSGAMCLEKTKQKYYHVILMDYMMPEMDGVETLKELRRQENGLCRESAVIILTANILTGARQLCRDFGFDSYLEKPIQAERLEAEILRFLPEDIIEYRMYEGDTAAGENEMQRISRRKRKKIYITSDCVSDLPEELLEKYDIKLMYLYIKTEKGRFADTKEIDSDSLSQYLSQDSCSVHADSVSVEEYEEFFAEVLTQAEHVIHVSMAAHAGKSYGAAVSAARGFDHVHVIDSGHISGGEGLAVLYAAKLAQEGHNTREICEEVRRIKNRIETKFLMPSARFFYLNGYTGVVTAKICDVLKLHPVLATKQSRIMIVGVRRGKLENAWKYYIRYHLFKKWKIETDVVVITYAGCSVRQQEMIRKEVLKCIPFQKVIMQKSSFSNACNSGPGTIGIAYYVKE